MNDSLPPLVKLPPSAVTEISLSPFTPVSQLALHSDFCSLTVMDREEALSVVVDQLALCGKSMESMGLEVERIREGPLGKISRSLPLRKSFHLDPNPGGTGTGARLVWGRFLISGGRFDASVPQWKQWGDFVDQARSMRLTVEQLKSSLIDRLAQLAGRLIIWNRPECCCSPSTLLP
jgi:hypothetical protein